MTDAPLSTFEKVSFTAPLAGEPRTFDVFRRGAGPPVVLIQELPGIGPETLAFADRLVTAGFEAWLPHLFGPLGRTSSLNLVRVLCMRRAFQLFAKHRTDAIVGWLRALCADVKSQTGAPGVGVIGMCLTGGFALAMIADDAVLAAAASQPSLPITDQSALKLSDAEIDASRAALDAKGAMLAFRFEGDRLCTASRFAAIDAAFNDDDAPRVELHTLPGDGHAVFTLHFVDDGTGPTARAFKGLVANFHARLTPARRATAAEESDA